MSDWMSMPPEYVRLLEEINSLDSEMEEPRKMVTTGKMLVESPTLEYVSPIVSPLVDEDELGVRVRWNIHHYLNIVYNRSLVLFNQFVPPQRGVYVRNWPLYPIFVRWLSWVDSNRWNEGRFLNSLSNLEPLPMPSEFESDRCVNIYLAYQHKMAGASQTLLSFTKEPPKTSRDLVPAEILECDTVIRRKAIELYLESETALYLDFDSLVLKLTDESNTKLPTCFTACVPEMVEKSRLNGDISENSLNPVSRMIWHYLEDPLLEALAIAAYYRLKSQINLWLEQEKVNFTSVKQAVATVKESLSKDTLMYERFRYMVSNWEDAPYDNVIMAIRRYLEDCLTKPYLAKQLVEDSMGPKSLSNALFVARSHLIQGQESVEEMVDFPVLDDEVNKEYRVVRDMM